MNKTVRQFIFTLLVSFINFGWGTSVSAQCTFANPVSGQAPDPWVIQKDGFYYFCHTTGGNVTLYKSDKLETVAQGTGVKVWLAPGGSPFPYNIWAPELHYINGKWYIYVCGNRNNSFTGHETFVLEGTTQNPMDPYIYKGRLENGIDGSVIQMNDGSLYFTWSYYNPDQRIYMAKMTNPWTLAQPYVELSKPEFSWETSGAGVNEGPEFLQSGNTLMVVYSASGSWTKDYCLGLVYCNGGDLMSKANWTKLSYPVFQTNVTNSIYGPGHCSFTKSPDGLQNWIAFHAKNSNVGGWDNRTLHLQPFTFMSNNLPNFGIPKSEGTQIPCPAPKPQLVITSFSPACGSAGTSVTITGTNLTAATSILFNGVAGTKTSNSSTQIIVTAPSGVSTGTLSVTNAYGTDISSGTFTVAADPTIAITLSSGTNPDCAGSALTFTATRTNGGSAPAYQWKVNGVNTGTNSATFSSSILANSDDVSCILTSNGSCVTTTTATSNTITLTRYTNKTPGVTIAFTSGTNPSCAGTSQTFTTTPTNGGTTPVYQWKVNGVVAGTNSATFTSSTLANSSIVSCTMTTSLTCVTATTDVSNSITLTRTTNVTPTVSIALTSGTNPSCAGTSLTYTATPANGGTTPVYQWKANGVVAGTNSATFTSSTLANSSIVTCTMTTSLTCVTAASATSNAITQTVNTIPKVNAGTDQNAINSTATLSGNVPLAGVTGNWTSAGTSSIVAVSDPLSAVNGLVIGANTFRWTLTNGACSAFDEVTINRTTVTGVNTQYEAKANYTVYPNPFTKEVKLMIESNATERLKIMITDMKGALVYSSDEFTTNQEILLNHDIPVGVLLVQVILGEEVRRFKIVKISQ
jgi:GH43 family beta-xylosidase